MASIPSGGRQGFGPNRVTPAPKKQPTLPDGSGFNRIVMNRARRADSKNLPGPTNHFGDRIGPGVATNNQVFPQGQGKGLAGIQYRNPRLGQKYKTGMTSTGRTVHVYNSGERVVLPKKKVTYKY